MATKIKKLTIDDLNHKEKQMINRIKKSYTTTVEFKGVSIKKGKRIFLFSISNKIQSYFFLKKCYKFSLDILKDDAINNNVSFEII